MKEINNKIGNITFSENIIKTIVKDAVDVTDGDATLYNFKGKYVVHNEKTDLSIEEGEDGYDITMYIVVKFGKSLSKVAHAIIDKVYDDLETMLGITPNSVKVIVKGVQSKEVAKRNIEFSREDNDA